MTRRKPVPPAAPPSGGSIPPRGILELERFSQESLKRWNVLSQDLDELQAALYFGVQPEQRRLRQQLIDALALAPAHPHTLSRWTRIVTYRYSTEPLSSAGSLMGMGGRFNPGQDLDSGTLAAFPALYLAEDHETAFREKFQIASADRVEGLTPQELALAHTTSHATVFVNGSLLRVFDMTSPARLDAVAKILGRIKMPQRARVLRKRLRVETRQLRMITTGRQLYDAVLTHNWRVLPVQFGLPAAGHTIAELVRAAGFEAILYRSTKGSKRCLAVFPDALTSGSFVELADPAPAAVRHTRLDDQSADDLSM